jgi:nicotinate-nucleotide pyrophosphorylase (carboxylating)
MPLNHLGVEMIEVVPSSVIQKMVANALEEDVQGGDITASLIPIEQCFLVRVITREKMVMVGRAWVEETFKQVDPTVLLSWHVQDGDLVEANATLFEAKGSARGILTAERTALNFVQMLSGTATTTRLYVDLISHTKTKVLDTRKTIPGFRLAQKYAVRCGGGENHRIGLFDAFLIKENHIEAAGSITNAVAKARAIAANKMVEVEVENFDELNQALAAGAYVIMLDNFSNEDKVKAVQITAGRAKLEASGNVELDTIAAIAETGVDYISSGALTKHIQAVDLSMRFV